MPRARATLDGTVLAESDNWETVEGNIYVSPFVSNFDYQDKSLEIVNIV
jgi:hypothetical protein